MVKLSWRYRRKRMTCKISILKTSTLLLSCISLFGCAANNQTKLITISGCNPEQARNSQEALSKLLDSGWEIKSTSPRSEVCGYTTWTTPGEVDMGNGNYGTVSSKQSSTNTNYGTSTDYVLKRSGFNASFEIFTGKDTD